MTKSNPLTLKQQENLKAYKELPLKDQVAILASITRLKQIQAAGDVPSQDAMLKLLNETGHLAIAVDCYAASLHGINFDEPT